MCHIFIIHLFADGHVSWFHFLAVASNVKSTNVQGSGERLWGTFPEWVAVSPGHVFNVFISLHTDFYNN